MKCPLCKKGTMRPWDDVEETFGVKTLVRGEKCGACGETLVTSDEINRQNREIAAAVVARGIRTGAEFKFVRKVAGMRAVDLAELFGVDVKTVSRWETDEIDAPRLARYVLLDLLEHPKRTRERLAAFGRDHSVPAR